MAEQKGETDIVVDQQILDDAHAHASDEQEQLEQEVLQVKKTTSSRGDTMIVFLFYTAHSLTSWSDRMWYLAMPLVFAAMYPNTLLPVALFQFISQSICVVLGTYAGYFVDRKSRPFVMFSSIIVQNLSVCACSACLVVLLYITGEHKKNENEEVVFVWPFKTTQSILLYSASVLFGALSELASMASSVSFQKDWAIIVSSSFNRSLENMNALLRRIDLICNIVSPIVFTLVLRLSNTLVAIIFVCAWNFISMFPELLSMVLVYKGTPALWLPKVRNEETAERNIAKVFISGWRTYMKQGVFLCSIAFVFLFITVLHSGPLLLSFLASVGLDNTIIAVFYAICAIGGVAATFVTPYVITKFKLIPGGLYSIWFQFSTLFIGLCLFATYQFLGRTDGKCGWFCWLCIGTFMASVVVSRFGLFGFDLAEIQIMQSFVQESDRGTVNATEKSLTKIAELVIYLFAIVLSKPSQFFYLVLISTGCILTAAVIYTIWTRMKFARDVCNSSQTAVDHEEHPDLEEQHVDDEEQQQLPKSVHVLADEEEFDVVDIELTDKPPQ